jgi:hypothetical protein
MLGWYIITPRRRGGGENYGMTMYRPEHLKTRQNQLIESRSKTTNRGHVITTLHQLVEC